MRCHIKLFTLPMDLDKANQFNRAMKVETGNSQPPTQAAVEVSSLARVRQVQST